MLPDPVRAAMRASFAGFPQDKMTKDGTNDGVMTKDTMWKAATSKACCRDLLCRLASFRGWGVIQQSKCRAQKSLEQLALGPNAREHANAE